MYMKCKKKHSGLLSTFIRCYRPRMSYLLNQDKANELCENLTISQIEFNKHKKGIIYGIIIKR